MNKLSQIFAPDFITNHIKTADDYHDLVSGVNPLLSEYVMRPSDMLELFKNEGFEGLGKELKEKSDSFGKYMANRKKDGNSEVKWDDLQTNTKLVEKGLGILGGNPLETITGLKDMFGGSGLQGIQKKIDIKVKEAEITNPEALERMKEARR